MKRLLLVLAGFWLVAPMMVPPQSAHAGETLAVWTSWGVVREFVDQLGKEFSQKQPSLRVEATLFPQRALEAKIATALPAGTGPDLLIINTSAVWDYWHEKLLAPLPTAHAEWARKVFFSGAVDDLSDYQQQMIGLPYIYYIEGMYYNLDHFRSAGVSRPPATADDMLSTAKRVTVIENGVVTRQGISLRLGGGGHGIAEKFWAQAMIPFGIQPVERIGTGWRAGYSNARGVDAVRLYLRALYGDRSATFDLKGDAEGFVLGVSSMFQRESFVLDMLRKNKSPMRYATTLMPKGQNGWGTVAGTLGAVVPSASKRKDLAFEFARFLNSPENALRLTETTGWMTAHQDVNYSTLESKLPGLKTFVDSMKTPGYTVYGYPRIAPLLEILTRFSERLSTAFQNKQLWDNRGAIEQLLNESANETNRLLKERDMLAK